MDRPRESELEEIRQLQDLELKVKRQNTRLQALEPLPLPAHRLGTPIGSGDGKTSTDRLNSGPDGGVLPPKKYDAYWPRGRTGCGVLPPPPPPSPPTCNSTTLSGHTANPSDQWISDRSFMVKNTTGNVC